MKRDMDLIRQLMTDFEDMPLSGYTNGEYDLIGQGGVEFQSKLEHLRLLFEAGLIEGEVNINHRFHHMSIFKIQRVTWKGHDFLDATRNPSVWDKTKDRAKKVGGWTFDLLIESAKEELKRRLLGAVPD